MGEHGYGDTSVTDQSDAAKVKKASSKKETGKKEIEPGDAVAVPSESAPNVATPAEATPDAIAPNVTTATIPDPPPKKHSVWGLGRRKSAVARVRIRPGKGEIKVNKRDLDVFFTQEKDRALVVAPLKATQTFGKVDVYVNVGGGGYTGQSGAIVLGVARALKTANVDYESVLRENGYLTRDSRIVERKKYGRRGARRRVQFSKR